MSPYKRLFDIVVTTLAIPAWLPAMILTTFIILLFNGWPAIYVSRRYVRKNSYGNITKFRTMVRNAEKIANRDTIHAEPDRQLNLVIDRNLYTKLGIILEKIHFTELPQLFQIFTGVFTLVGNRPMPDNMLRLAREHYPFVEERFSIPCGITGPAQLVGREKLTDVQRLKIEITYAYICQDAYSPLLDLHLLIITVLTPFGYGRNISIAQMEDLLFNYCDADKIPLIKQRVANALAQ